MKEKIETAKRFRQYRKVFEFRYKKAIDKNVNTRKLLSKCYRTCIMQYVIKGKKRFQISFEGKYIQNELMLEKFFKDNGFKIIDEHLYASKSIYDVCKI